MASVQLLEKATYHRKIMNPSCDRFLSAARDSDMLVSDMAGFAPGLNGRELVENGLWGAGWDPISGRNQSALYDWRFR